MRKHIGTLTALGLAALLTACGGSGGGGGGDAVSNANAEGAWTGTNSLGNAFVLVVLENGDLYSMYGTASGSSFTALGFDRGHASISGTSLSGTITQYDFNGNKIDGSLAATVVSNTSINGLATPNGGSSSTTFFATPLSATYSAYHYNTAAAISDIAGAWSGNVLDLAHSAATFSIDAGGNLTGTNLACAFTGTVTPRPSGKNVFNVSMHFAATSCTLAGQDASGIAISYVLANGKRQFILATENTAKNKGSMLFAQR